MKIALSLIVLTACVGCGPKTETAVAPPKDEPTAPVSERAMTLIGPGGSVMIGGTLADAKMAFPAPKGAEVYDTSMNFAILGTEGWAWGEGMGTGFEVAIKDGRIVGFAQTRLDGPAPDDAIEQEKKEIGEPTRMFDGKTAAMAVWESGANARFFVLFKGDNSIFGAGSLTIIGDKEQLKLLNYRYDDPETFVKQMDNAAKQMEELEKSKGKSESGKP